MKNPYGKTADIDNPHLTIRAHDWTWRVLKVYQRPDLAAANPHARALCYVTSPFTLAGADFGDCYVREIPNLREHLLALAERIRHEQA